MVAATTTTTTLDVIICYSKNGSKLIKIFLPFIKTEWNTILRDVRLPTILMKINVFFVSLDIIFNASGVCLVCYCDFYKDITQRRVFAAAASAACMIVYEWRVIFCSSHL